VSIVAIPEYFAGASAMMTGLMPFEVGVVVLGSIFLAIGLVTVIAERRMSRKH
jgi:Ca2+/Na+ antiporter